MAGNVKDVTIKINVIDGDIKKTGKDFDNLNKKVKTGTKEMNNSLSSMNKGLLKLGGAMAGAFAIKAVIGDAVQRIVAFEKSISSLSAITGAVGQDLDKLKGIVLKTAKETKKSAIEIAKGFELVGSAQPALLKNADALALVTKNSITLSKASGLDLTTSVNAVTTGMAQFNLTADDSALVMDALAAGAKAGASAIPETSAAIEKFGAVANGANVSITDSVALVETLATKQLKGAEAGNNLKNIILKLKNAGLGFVDGQFDINAALEETKNKFDGIEDPVKRSQAQTKLFGLESATAGQILLDNIGTFEGFQGAVSESGVALTQAGIQMDNLAGRVEEMDATYESFLLSLEDGTGVFSTISKGAIEGFTGILESMTALNEFEFSESNGILGFLNNADKFTTNINEILNPAVAQMQKDVSKSTEAQRTFGLALENNALVVGKLGEALKSGKITGAEYTQLIKDVAFGTEKSEKAIEGETDALDTNTDSTNTNNTSKKKSLTLLEKQLKLQADKKKAIKEERGIGFEDAEKEEETVLAETFDADLDRFFTVEEEKTAKLKEERQQRLEDEAEAFEEKMAMQEENDATQLELDQAFADAKGQIDEQLLFSALGLAGAIAQAAGDSMEAQAAALAFDKIAAIASIVINTQKANALLAAQLGLAAIPLQIKNNIAGALGVATVLATAIPQVKQIQSSGKEKKLKDGEIMIQGAGTETSDSIPALLSKNESVINAASSKKHTAVLKAINDDRFDE